MTVKKSVSTEKEFEKSLKAVALKYPEGSDSPFITAIGKGEKAKEVLKIAKMNDIIIVENEELTDVLSFQEVGDSVPPETWDVLAKIFAFVFKTQKESEINEQA